ncbi:septation protein A [Lampropedia puyangensis]|uniref:Inner membrane-spanning protein YciB n=1 Tax=Lampropedia puyangensis TaxID=1330072 RepID=A0A4S8F0X8_9BURK|nr:septation protein A [Lampropedia puyangensis]THT99683.1 septation protein A [Lampropedia puyangensis]
MKFLFDVLPFALFFVSYRMWDIYVATGVAIAASVLQIIVTYISGRKVETMQWVSMGLIGVFGGMTLVLQNPIFVMWRSSIVNWLLAAVLLVSLVVLRKNPLKALMGAQLQMPDFAWRIMTWSMIALFTFMGVLNIVVAKNFSESMWVNYKTFGSPLITFAFFIVLMLALSKHITVPGQDEPVKNDTPKP